MNDFEVTDEVLMDKVEVFTPLSLDKLQSRVQPLWDDLRNAALPKICEIWKCPLSEFRIVSYSYFPTSHWHSQYRDKAVLQQGLLPGLPVIQINPMHGKKLSSYGLTLMQCRENKELEYFVYLNLNTNNTNHCQIILRDKQVFSIVRACKKLERKLVQNNEPPVMDAAVFKGILDSTVGFLDKEKAIQKWGVTMNRGIVLDGPPGNGKTMLCRYIHKECTNNNIDAGIVTASEIDKAYADNKLSSLFSNYTVTFFDDIDIAYFNRKNDNGKMACAMLTAMDGMIKTNGLVVRIFTTNEAVDSFDSAFIRPGRIDQFITVPKPTSKLLRESVNRWPEEIKNAIDISYLVEKMEGRSFAEVESVRVNLVSNYLFGTKDWRLDLAMKKFLAPQKIKQMGFV